MTNPQRRKGSAAKFPNENFPGTQLDLDLLAVCARLRQVQIEGVDTCGGIIFDRLFTCDLPRLLRHVSTEALNWDAAEWLQGTQP